ncbi:MAG: rhodanese-like domain-containing protein [Burkholderiales bacterium]
MKVRSLSISGLLTLLVLVLAACGETTGAAPAAAAATQGLPVLSKNSFGFVDLSVQQLAKSMTSKNFTLVNVHVPNREGLPNTDLSVPFDQITANLDKLPGKDAPIVLYCRSGGMSTQAAAALAAAGYTRIYALNGGFSAWKAAGYELLNK